MPLGKSPEWVTLNGYSKKEEKTDAKKDSKDAKVSELIKKPVIEKIDWSKVNKDIEKMIIEARKETQELASAKLDTWIEQNMKRVDNDFLEWYFSYWTQQKLGLQSLLAQVWHWVDGLIFLPGTFFTPLL
jgi:hypothetical protein